MKLKFGRPWSLVGDRLYANTKKYELGWMKVVIWAILPKEKKIGSNGTFMRISRNCEGFWGSQY